MYTLDKLSVDAQVRAIGKTIQVEIDACDHKKTRLAEESGLSVNTINNAIAGKNINIQSLVQIAWVLGYNMSDFMDLVATHAGDIPDSPQDDVQEAAEEPVLDAEAIRAKMETAGQSEDQMAARVGRDDLKAVAPVYPGDSANVAGTRSN